MAIEDDLRAWAEGALIASGRRLPDAWEVVKARPWADVYRAETSDGRVYVKRNGPVGAHEPEMLEALAARWPDRVPTPLAVDVGASRTLVPDHGPMLSEVVAEHDRLAHWEVILPRCAELQLSTAGEGERWRAAGVPDRRAARMVEQAERLVDTWGDVEPNARAGVLERLPAIARCAEALDALEIPDTIEHGDLHGNNVLYRDGVHWIFDFADASYGNPLTTLLIVCNMACDDMTSPTGRAVCARLRDAYLEGFPTRGCATSVRATRGPRPEVGPEGASDEVPRTGPDLRPGLSCQSV